MNNLIKEGNTKVNEHNSNLCMDSLFKKGDSVVVGIHDNTSQVSAFRIGTVVFAGPYFVTVETECTDPITGKVTAFSDCDTHEAFKIRRSFDITDLKKGALVPINKHSNFKKFLNLNKLIQTARYSISVESIFWYAANVDRFLSDEPISEFSQARGECGV